MQFCCVSELTTCDFALESPHQSRRFDLSAPININSVYTGRELWTHLEKSESTFYRMLKDGLSKYGSNHSGVWLFAGRNLERWVMGLPPVSTESDLTNGV
ncbi:hypothetical protein UFOVP1229_41 [uncultured Caudovirales phage]|uniref:Helix-turn-helix domain containing protein n=1 Tax=uncultured Caudovirales phage TaxID=2100421 RepID=A0A6J5RAZ5_9CAUD|nr:hypothetical protein UFOVP1229_41 [uncultured Caudovirales phage]